MTIRENAVAPGAFWREESPLVLASASPVRRQMLQAVLLPVECVVSGVDERKVETSADDAGSDGPKIAALLADAKAHAVSARFASRYVVGADQTLTLGSLRLNKAASEAELVDHLMLLSGKTHELHSAFALYRNGNRIAGGVDSARLTMRPFDRAFAQAYVAACGNELLGSVGGYQIEGAGAHLFRAIEGEHHVILGLPLLRLLSALRETGLVAS